MDTVKKDKKKLTFCKLISLCFPMLKLNKKPTAEQQEIIDTVNETIDQIQEHIEEYIEGISEEQEDIKVEQLDDMKIELKNE